MTDLPPSGKARGSVPVGVQAAEVSLATTFIVGTSVTRDSVAAGGLVVVGVLSHAESIILVNTNIEDITNRLRFTFSSERICYVDLNRD